MQQVTQIVDNTWQFERSDRDQLRQRIHEQRFSHIEAINFAKAQAVTIDTEALRNNRVLTGLEPDLFTESYHLLRTQILKRFDENSWNTLAVTSPDEGEGKTLTALNLAISMAREIDYSVLLVDANLRKPAVLEKLGLKGRKGLSDYLLDDLPIETLLFKSSQFGDLTLLPAGEGLDNSSEMLNSPKMQHLVNELKTSDEKRVIIFDLPAVLPTTDALAFSSQVDAALLVVADGVTKKRSISCAIERLSGTNIVGTVMNKQCKAS